MKKFRRWLRVRYAYFLSAILFIPEPKTKLVIFGQGRTGSTLLVNLLNSCEDTFCDREIFNRVHFTGEIIKSPIPYIIGRSKRFNKRVYGFKVKIYQLEDDHHVQDAHVIIKELIAHGYKVVYLYRRNVLEHAFSNVRREVTGVTHIRNETHNKGRIEIPVQALVDEMRARMRYKVREDKVLVDIPYLQVVYEDDLLDADKQLETVNRIRAYLGLAKVNHTSTHYRKINDKPITELVSNWKDIRLALQKQGLDYLL